MCKSGSKCPSSSHSRSCQRAGTVCYCCVDVNPNTSRVLHSRKMKTSTSRRVRLWFGRGPRTSARAHRCREAPRSSQRHSRRRAVPPSAPSASPVAADQMTLRRAHCPRAAIRRGAAIEPLQRPLRQRAYGCVARLSMRSALLRRAAAACRARRGALSARACDKRTAAVICFIYAGPVAFGRRAALCELATRHVHTRHDGRRGVRLPVQGAEVLARQQLFRRTHVLCSPTPPLPSLRGALLRVLLCRCATMRFIGGFDRRLGRRQVEPAQPVHAGRV